MSTVKLRDLSPEQKAKLLRDLQNPVALDGPNLNRKNKRSLRIDVTINGDYQTRPGQLAEVYNPTNAVYQFWATICDIFGRPIQAERAMSVPPKDTFTLGVDFGQSAKIRIPQASPILGGAIDPRRTALKRQQLGLREK
jgi:hypothetical protein